MRQSMKWCAGILAALAAAMCLQGCEQSRHLKVAAHVWPGYEFMHLAKELHWLDPHQVELVPTAFAGESLEALIAGHVDAAALTLDEVLTARAEGVPLTVVMVFDVSAGADVVLRRPGVGQGDGLRGLRVGYEHGAVGALMLEKALNHEGLVLDDIVAIDLPPSRHVAAWNAGFVDALVTYEPVASQLQEQGATVAFDSGQTHNLIVDVLAIRANRLHWPHAGALRHLVAAHFRALEHFQRNSEDAAYRMAPRLSLKPNEVNAAFSGLVLPDIENNHRLLGGDAPPLLDSASELSSLMRSRNLLPSNKDDLGRLIDDHYLPAIKAK